MFLLTLVDKLSLSLQVIINYDKIQLDAICDFFIKSSAIYVPILAYEIIKLFNIMSILGERAKMIFMMIPECAVLKCICKCKGSDFI